jgi:hypothetical protein
MTTNNTQLHDLSFGVFDHMDQGRLPLADQYEQRLQLVQAYEQAGFYAACTWPPSRSAPAPFASDRWSTP